MLTTAQRPSGLPSAAAAAQIARLLEDLAQEARQMGFGGLAESIASVGIEASEEARHASRLRI
ncbi:hypothetical protein CCC_02427 [Paramagnetospirillum magnetotacticum MS-1]|uniref:Uncharacterized protein n=1 Tax=Paramagnetospirillum magnetotacticum MS-1 TaxID=272627 RepID=A0A0C2UBV7_PARME|nr:hypothetical protein [Paramagnetospirillum magnetotacticum]KIL98977.1 hypothetical protein CCC_02427 [Paramagnetospirillum magnetotacticum MS-1]